MVNESRQWLSIRALNIPKEKSQGQSLSFVHLFKIRIPFILFLDRKREKGCPTKVSKRLKSVFQGSVDGNCFPSLKIATFKLTMWGKRNNKYELLFKQTASIWSLSPLPLGIHMPQSS